MRAIPALLLTLATALPAHAACLYDVGVTFREGAPRDRFTVTNDNTTANITAVEIDLNGSAGRLIFDTIAGGSGVEVFQPYRSETDGTGLIGAPVVADGATSLALRFDNFGPGQSYTFSIDVDDRLTQSDMGQIMVSDREIDGTIVRVSLRAADGSVSAREATFEGGGPARLTGACG